ncbi:hypothetical protein C1H46_020758 [Malus baccata]|uniref:Peptidase metallopeptidase domain-containing protein n=1 Tax=Malus baccata TaxID=106549 RepID=A0A540M4K1_MALBA|nr:hypothetical protein C1H46_020758 [Malus baccata]
MKNFTCEQGTNFVDMLQCSSINRGKGTQDQHNKTLTHLSIYLATKSRKWPPKPCVALSLLIFVLLSQKTLAKPTDDHDHKHDSFEFIQYLEGCHKGQNVSGLQELKKHLTKFGYFNYDHSKHADDDEFDHLKMMVPRCGVPDVVNGTRKGSKNARQVPGTENVRSICAQAFQRWTQVTTFTFEEVPSTSAADITIGFHRGNHGDRSPFDGFKGTYAHANPPGGGNFHFDADETWSANPGPNEIDLESVSVHEIGHLLGLNHNPDLPDAIMYPYFEYGMVKRDLNRDDIDGIRALYGLQ